MVPSFISFPSSQKHYLHLLYFEFLSAFKHSETETFHNTCKSSLSAKDKMPSKIMTLAPYTFFWERDEKVSTIKQRTSFTLSVLVVSGKYLKRATHTHPVFLASMCSEVIHWDFYTFPLFKFPQGGHKQLKVESSRMVKVVVITGC